MQYALSYICVFYSIDKRHLLVETNETAPSVDYLDKKKKNGRSVISGYIDSQSYCYSAPRCHSDCLVSVSIYECVFSHIK